MTNLFLDKLQPHTIRIYGLDKENDYIITHINARELLSFNRFDLFAKLYYIDKRVCDIVNAKMVYSSHIKAFNPDGKEPGRSDKNNVEDFLASFEDLIKQFSICDFDDSKSIIPVDKNNVILDGAHRVASLAYFNKNVKIVKFNNICAKCNFDYQYFKNRGLSWAINDEIFLEATKWMNSLFCAVIWPCVKSELIGVTQINNKFKIVYERCFDVNFKSLNIIVHEIYKNQDWTKSEKDVRNKSALVYGKSKRIKLIFFNANDDLDKILDTKEVIRNEYEMGKHSIHITDSDTETIDLANLFLSKDGKKIWQSSLAFKDSFREKIFRLKKIHFLKLKIVTYKIISYCKKPLFR